MSKKIHSTLADFCGAELSTSYALRNQYAIRAKKYSDFANDLINDFQILFLLNPNLVFPYDDIKTIIKGNNYITDEKKLQLLSLMQ